MSEEANQDKKPYEKINPQKMEGYLAGGCDTIEKIVMQIYLIDRSIFMWAEELYRAQPLFKGKLIINFGKNNAAGRVRVGDEYISEVIPYPVRMLKRNSGAWFVKRLERTPEGKWKDGIYEFENLEEFRVGKSLSSDRVVLRLIRGIEQMLKQRESLLGLIISLRLNSIQQIQMAEALRSSSFSKLEMLSSRIKLDWRNDLQGAINHLKEENLKRKIKG
jgi:hypothetical protein